MNMQMNQKHMTDQLWSVTPVNLTHTSLLLLAN